MGSTVLKPTRRPRALAIAAALAPYAIALWFGAYSLRGLDCGTPVDTDAARHAMNGAFVHDLLQHGDPLHLIAFAKSYYSRYPSLSIPYHPPLFPLFEALFMFVLGVNYLSARMSVAVATALSAWLLYRLALKTHGSAAVAAASTVLFFSLSSSLMLASDVMLEMPALVLILAAMLLLPGLDGAWSMRRGMAFALVAAAAVWTKQNAVFLGLVPFAWVVLERRWRALKSAALWLPAVVFGVLVLLLAWIAAVFGVAGNHRWPPFKLVPILTHNVPYYFEVMRSEFGVVGVVLIVAAAALALAGVLRHGGSHANTPYLAWAACVFAVAFLMPPYDFRYVYVGYPALAVVVCSMLFEAGKRVLPARLAWGAPAALAALWFVTHVATPPAYVHGPAETARLISPAQPGRILYFGRSNGHFTFAMRTLDRERKTAIIRGDKLPHAAFAPGGLEKFAHDYGVNYVVFERRPLPRRWDAIADAPPPSFELVADVPLSSSDERLNGQLRVFKFLSPSPTPISTLRLKASGVPLDVDLSPERNSQE